MSGVLKIAAIQLRVGSSKTDNLMRCAEMVSKALENKVELITLPECFNSPYGIEHFKKHAEQVPDGESCRMMSELARKNNVFIVGGSIPEKDDNRFYNTCTVWNPLGEMVSKFRKVHLFDIDIPGKITFQESKVLSAGNSLATFTVNSLKIGIGICYDMRFPELAQSYRSVNCDALIYPGAFNMTTGPAHWTKLQMGRAIDNQVYVITCSPARNTDGSYVAYGHSSVVDPWGEVIVEAGHEEQIIYADINGDMVQTVRNQIPIIKQRRPEVYHK